VIGQTALHYLNVFRGAATPVTQTTQVEREMLCKFLPNRKCIVEVGVFEGFTTHLLAAASDWDAVVYGIDPFFGGRLGIAWGKLIAENYNRDYLNKGKVRFVCRKSPEIDNEIPDLVDYVFIDADHSLEGITRDWSFWSDRLKSDGIIALHDTLISENSPNELGSHRYFKSHIQYDTKFEVIGQKDSLSVLRKY
jgi:predicted O-methyltransferase YrrM